MKPKVIRSILALALLIGLVLAVAPVRAGRRQLVCVRLVVTTPQSRMR